MTKTNPLKQSGKAWRYAAMAAIAWLACACAVSAGAQQIDASAALNKRLFEAVRANDMASVRSVLTSGADPMAVDKDGQTPAGIAVDRGYYDIAHYILGVRNQREALEKREAKVDLGTPQVIANSEPARVERTPEKSWRDTAVAGQPTEIPSPRLSAPSTPVVVGPSAPKRPTKPIRAAKTEMPTRPTASKPAAAPQLTNLPTLPPGSPNPFDPAASAPASPPLASQPVAPSAAPQTEANSQSTDSPSTGGGGLSRFFNGITGIFNGRGS